MARICRETCEGETRILNQLLLRRVEMEPVEWLLGDDTGRSSETIWAVMMGVDTRSSRNERAEADERF